MKTLITVIITVLITTVCIYLFGAYLAIQDGEWNDNEKVIVEEI